MMLVSVFRSGIQAVGRARPSRGMLRGSAAPRLVRRQQPPAQSNPVLVEACEYLSTRSLHQPRSLRSIRGGQLGASAEGPPGLELHGGPSRRGAQVEMADSVALAKEATVRQNGHSPLRPHLAGCAVDWT